MCQKYYDVEDIQLFNEKSDICFNVTAQEVLFMVPTFRTFFKSLRALFFRMNDIGSCFRVCEWQTDISKLSKFQY